MQRLFLCSSIDRVASRVAQELGETTGRRLVFIRTAAEAKPGDLKWLKADRQGLVDAGFTVTDYTVTGKTSDQVQSDLESFDVIHMEGGNPFYLLQKLQESQSIPVIRDLVMAGKVYIGSSAGSIVAGPDIYPSYRLVPEVQLVNLADYQGLRLVDFVVLPHWGSEHFKDRFLNQRLEHNYNDKNKLILLTDNQYIRVDGDQYKIIDICDEKKEALHAH